MAAALLSLVLGQQPIESPLIGTYNDAALLRSVWALRTSVRYPLGFGNPAAVARIVLPRHGVRVLTE